MADDAAKEKRRRVRWVQRYVVNPPAKVAVWAGLVPGFVLVETTGRRSGKRRLNVVGIRVEGDTGWVVAEYGRHAGYVSNLEAHPDVRVRDPPPMACGPRHILDDDDPQARLDTFDRRAHEAVGAAVRDRPAHDPVRVSNGLTLRRSSCNHGAVVDGGPATYRIPVTVVLDSGAEEVWEIERVVVRPHELHRMTLRATDGRTWTSEGGDVFGCLCDIRQETDPLGIKLCVNGARRNVWATGMARDMGQGISVEVFEEEPRRYGHQTIAHARSGPGRRGRDARRAVGVDRPVVGGTPTGPAAHRHGRMGRARRGGRGSPPCPPTRTPSPTPATFPTGGGSPGPALRVSYSRRPLRCSSPPSGARQ